MARALISVSDKRGVVELASALVAHGVEICSTGGTAYHLSRAGIPVTPVEALTGMPEMLDGRVKTLHPAIHAGILARRDLPDHLAAIHRAGIDPIDYLIVNLYPFKETVARPDVTLAEAVEQIDIGGPSLLRAAAKNFADVLPLVDPDDYAILIAALETGEPVPAEVRLRLAAKVFRHTAAYDAIVAAYLTDQAGETAPERLTLTFERQQGLRYGENPHQAAGFYREPFAPASSIAGARQLQGKELSHINIQDADAALAIVREFTRPAVVAVKHTNPCGVGTGATIEEAYAKAYAADPVSIFGGIVAFNEPVPASCAERMAELFLEIIIAPDFAPEALAILQRKKNLRLLRVAPPTGVQAVEAAGGRPPDRGRPPDAPTRPSAAKPTGVDPKSPRGDSPESSPPVAYPVVRSVSGGLLVQEPDRHVLRREDCRVVTERAPTEDEWARLLFAWTVVKHVKSNAIVLTRDDQTVGVGAGQMNRVGAARIAIEQAGDLARGAVLASDAYFPMRDTVDTAAAAGVTAIIQPGGSIRDAESIAAANEAGLAMVFTGVRHFRH
ncbi:MAG TPA: bifunctional phosphoribosylaminoimidazolecarboxamide formyltransferase/IMP cyclohydrolase [Ktedonobacterales bacterium]